MAILYVVRWIVLVPLGWLVDLMFAPAQISDASISIGEMNPLAFFLVAVVIDPPLETVVECALPYSVISWIRNYRQKRPKRCWGYVAISACVMAVLHPVIAALPFSLITGAFLAYCYAHFAPISTWRAIFATAAFHAAINLVGWVTLVIS
ncbi:MAG: hypothetical protein ABSG68_22600 [Thermoguttaceae bacterium]